MLRLLTKYVVYSPRTTSPLIARLHCPPYSGGVVVIGTGDVRRSAGWSCVTQDFVNALSVNQGTRFISSNSSNFTSPSKITGVARERQIFSPPLSMQTMRWTSTTSQTPDSAGADGSKTQPSPHFKTRKNLEVQKAKEAPSKLPDNIQAATDERWGDQPYLLPHPIWSEDEMDSVIITHKPPLDRVDKAAYYSCKALRTGFDIFSGFAWGKRTERKWVYRIIFLETVAGVPGMVAAMTRHLRSLRKMQRDHGWIHTLLEEAENERMHLMTALEIKQPSLFFRLMVLGAQGIFVNVFFISYMICPRFCHRFVGYLEEEAVITYTKLLKDLNADALPAWKDKAAPEIAVNYWKLGPNANFIDLFRAIRADEAHHREVNHTLSDINPDEPNPYGPGK